MIMVIKGASSPSSCRVLSTPLRAGMCQTCIVNLLPRHQSFVLYRDPKLRTVTIKFGGRAIDREQVPRSSSLPFSESNVPRIGLTPQRGPKVQHVAGSRSMPPMEVRTKFDNVRRRVELVWSHISCGFAMRGYPALRRAKPFWCAWVDYSGCYRAFAARTFLCRSRNKRRGLLSLREAR